MSETFLKEDELPLIGTIFCVYLIFILCIGVGIFCGRVAKCLEAERNEEVIIRSESLEISEA